MRFCDGKIKLIAVLLALAPGFHYPAFAESYGLTEDQLEAAGPSDPKLHSYIVAFTRNVYNNWSPYTSSGRRGSIKLIFSIEPGGRVEPSVAIPEGRIEDIFSVMDAVLSEPSPGPVPESPGRDHAKPLKGRIEFYSKAFSLQFGSPRNIDNARFFAAHRDLDGKAVIFHPLPLGILHRYPEAFTAQELHDLSNMRPVSISKLCSSKPYPRQPGYIFPWVTTQQMFKDPSFGAIYRDWQNFFDKHKTASRAVLLAQKNKLDKKYAGLFMTGALTK